ncbi:MAG: twin-arginine translocase TatA/TatE family subunit [Polyangiaceae bacterium]|nr:twin-arginine translocase TatA/TatE family subunit [Polyangiaceae bacterium]
MFGISLVEIALIAVVALVVVGPQKLPGMLRTLGEWMGKLRRLTTEVRAQTGIDDILRQEGIDGGLSELRSIMRGDLRGIVRGPRPAAEHSSFDDPYEDSATIDALREYPLEGADAHGALPDDLVDDEDEPAAEGPAAEDEPSPAPERNDEDA